MLSPVDQKLISIIFCFDKFTPKYCSDIVEFIVVKIGIPKVGSYSTSLYWNVYQCIEIYKGTYFTHGFLVNR